MRVKQWHGLKEFGIYPLEGDGWFWHALLICGKMTRGNVEDSLEGRRWRLHNWLRSCCSGPSMEWTYLSQSELGVHPPCSHSIQYVPYLNVYDTMWNQLFTGLYSSQGCVPQEGKDGICFFIAVPLLHLEYDSEFMTETAKSCYLSPLISYHTHLLFSLMQLQRLSFSSNLTSPFFSQFLCSPLWTSPSSMNLYSSLSSFSSQKFYFFKEVFQKTQSKYSLTSLPFFHFTCTFLFFCLLI